MTPNLPELTVVFDVDLAGVLSYRSVAIARATDEAGRIGLWFPADEVAQAQADLSAGRANVEVRAWSSTIRRLHADYLSPSAKAAMRSRTQNG